MRVIELEALIGKCSLVFPGTYIVGMEKIVLRHEATGIARVGLINGEHEILSMSENLADALFEKLTEV